MSLLLVVGNFFLWSLLSLVSGIIGGYGLAAGFDGFKRTKAWVEQREADKKNESYLTNLEEEFMAGATRV